jgi:nucleoside-diphosphate-sugar epimerase
MKKKYLLIGNNIVSEYFKNNPDFEIVSWQWVYDSIDRLDQYSAVIYCEEMREGKFAELITVNCSIPSHIFDYTKQKKIPFIYISTAELYNGNYEWPQNTELSNELNISSDYLLTKRMCERLLEEQNALILRIKNPFSEYYHPDNWLVKILQNDEPFNWIDSYSYLPDLEKAIKVLLKYNKQGIYNVVQTETCSDLYYLQLLGIEKYKDIDIHFYETPAENKIGADVNSSKLKNFMDFDPMDFAVIYSSEKLKNNLDKSLFEGKVEVCE